MQIVLGLLIPFVGTSIGSSAVFLMRKTLDERVEKILLGFASGVMVAASVWSLIIPSIEMAESQNVISWLPSTIGFILGILFLLLLDYLIPKMKKKEECSGKVKKTFIMALAVTLHNIPEGMAVGVCFAGAISGNAGITIAGAMALAIGIAVQNIPEGAIISMPLKSEGMSKVKSFIFGILSGIVEPISAFLTLLITGTIEIILPYLLSFAAGAMIYVVVEELIPESKIEKSFSLGTIGFSVGFLIMMIMDIALG
ncbi:MAG: ZIP family metal transporter [Clostridia bacterium]|nr:ZIP family metal transporter [Clostridia bacterium]